MLFRSLDADEIMRRVDISRSTYTGAIGRLADANLLPEWITIKRRSHPERDVRDRRQAQLGGKVEAHTKSGPIDLLTETELIEIKIVHRWKDAIGHILAKSYKYPNHKKRLHLFGPEEPVMETIENACEPWEISVSFEKVDRPKPGFANATLRERLRSALDHDRGVSGVVVHVRKDYPGPNQKNTL